MIEAIIEQHALNVAMLWQLRDAATHAPHYALRHLGRLDERVEAHLDGLRIAEQAGWKICTAALEGGEAGEMFAAAVLAVERRDLEGIALVLDATTGEPLLLRGVAAALGWVPFDRVEAILPGLLDPGCPPALQWLGIAACAAHRRDPGRAIEVAIAADEPRLRGRALEAAGELGRADLLPIVERHVHAEDPDVRLRAAWSSVLLGSASAAQTLFELSGAGMPQAERAFSMAVRRAGGAAALWVQTLAARPETARTAVIGAGVLGEPSHVPWLLSCMEVPELSRVAAEAFARITGADLEAEQLEGEPPEGFQAGPNDDEDDSNVTPDPDENLPWPDVSRVRAFWEKARPGLRAEGRLFLGKPLGHTWLQEVLRREGQRRRADAVIELALLAPGRSPLFEVRAPAARQMALLG